MNRFHLLPHSSLFLLSSHAKWVFSHKYCKIAVTLFHKRHLKVRRRAVYSIQSTPFARHFFYFVQWCCDDIESQEKLENYLANLKVRLQICCVMFAVVERLPAAVGTKRLRRNQRHSHCTGESLETRHRTFQQVSQNSLDLNLKNHNIAAVYMQNNGTIPCTNLPLPTFS